MSTDNQVTFVGNLTRDLETRRLPSGTSTTTGTLAVTRRWRDRETQQWDERTTFLNLVIWGDIGTHAAASVGKGDRVCVIGTMEERSWETNEGAKRSVLEVQVDEISASMKWATLDVQRTERANGASAPAKAAATATAVKEAPF